MHTDVRREGLVSNDDFIKTVRKTWVIMRQVPESHVQIKLAKLVISFLQRHLARASQLAVACTSFQFLLTFLGACRHIVASLLRAAQVGVCEAERFYQPLHFVSARCL